MTKAKLQGKAYLQSFGELTQFLTVAKEPEKKETPPAAVAETKSPPAPEAAPPEETAS